jgi:hypothetical protein
MELVKFNTKSQKVVVAPLGDIQYCGQHGPTAVDSLKRHIDRVLAFDNSYFIGMGDYIDFLSPSNRQRLAAAALYDTADTVIDEKAHELTEELYENILKPTKGRWLGLIEGHHFYEGSGSTSDMWLCEMLDAQHIGTSALVRLEPSGIVFYAHHGTGAGQLPGTGLNKLYHTSNGWTAIDVYLMGHNTKLAASRHSRPQARWEQKKPDLVHSDVLYVNTGGFSKSNVLEHRRGRIPRGDYAEKGMMTPAPLSAPIVFCDGRGASEDRVWVRI